MTTQEKIETIIAEKREPFDAARAHLHVHNQTILDHESCTAAYVASPDPATLKDAVEAEKDVVALRSLRDRLAQRDFDKEFSEVLDRTFELAPLLHAQADESLALLEKCRARLIEFKTAVLHLPAPAPTELPASPRYSVNRRLKRFESEIAAAATALNGIHPVIDNWSAAGEDSVKSFNVVYARCLLVGARLSLYGDVADISDEHGCIGELPSLRAPESKANTKAQMKSAHIA